MEWQTSAPPVGKEIEFEDDSGEVRRGPLQHFAMTSRQRVPVDWTPVYAIPGNANTFTVRRWRNLD